MIVSSPISYFLLYIVKYNMNISTRVYTEDFPIQLKSSFAAHLSTIFSFFPDRSTLGLLAPSYPSPDSKKPSRRNSTPPYN